MIGEDEMRILMDDVPVIDELAGEEFSESWVHSKESQDQVSANSREFQDQGGTKTIAATPLVVAAVEDSYKKLQAATTDKERYEIRAELEKAIFRVAVSFTGEEADLVKSVLGFQPASKLLFLCGKHGGSILGAVNPVEQDLSKEVAK